MITCVCCEPAHKIKHLLPTCMRHLLLDMYVSTAKSAKNDHTLVKTIITNHVCIIQVATIYSAIFDMVIIYTLQVCRKFIIFLLCSQEENYFFHPCQQQPTSPTKDQFPDEGPSLEASKHRILFYHCITDTGNDSSLHSSLRHSPVS